MLENINIGDLYAINLVEIFGGTRYDARVIGVTYIDNVSDIQNDYNIYQTYFEPIGLGLTSYYNAIQSDTKIYICNSISSLDPLTITEDKIFIPETLIDFENSDHLIKAYSFNINIAPIIKRFNDENEIPEYKSKLIKDVVEKLNTLIDFSIMDIDVEINQDEFYSELLTISSIEAERQHANTEHMARINKNIEDESNKFRVLYQRLTEANEAKAEAKLAKDQYDQKSLYLDQLIIQYESLLR